jgi:hypothetical protein
MLPGVYLAKKKNGTVYYRSNLTYQGKHISLGSFATEAAANAAYQDAICLLTDKTISIQKLPTEGLTLSFEKSVILINFRDNGIYIKNPIYLAKGYFIYYLTPSLELKFDIDDLFYYSSHKIIQRQGRLFVNDYGMQCSVLSRYGIRPYAVAERDYTFRNGDSTDYRYANIIVMNPYHGVTCQLKNGLPKYRAAIHINGNYIVGSYSTEEEAAIAYNKAVDLAKSAGIRKDFPENYVDTCSPKKYADIYTSLKLSKKYLDYLDNIRSFR